MRVVFNVAVAKPKEIAAKASAIAKPIARRRAAMATRMPANTRPATAHQAGSRSAVKYATMPNPKATGSQGSNRPGAASARSPFRQKSAEPGGAVG